jgi:peptidoglycan/xylan/chitin deacetylase (PgdA/CDA1 family)
MYKKLYSMSVTVLAGLLMFGGIASAASYTVQPGDTIWKIATKHNMTTDALIQLNKLTSTMIYPGQAIIIRKNKAVDRPVVYSMGNPSKKQIALTFDDGPDDHYTPQILDILKTKGVKATFFIVGQEAKNHPDMLRRIFREGHALGNHSWDHPKLPHLSASQLIEEVQSTEAEIYKITGRKPDLFRPPYGLAATWQLSVLRDLGYRVIKWSVDTNDWQRLSDEQILSNVQKEVSPGGIILQHDFGGSPGALDGTVKALPQIIDQLRARGYEFVTVQTLLDPTK